MTPAWTDVHIAPLACVQGARASVFGVPPEAVLPGRRLWRDAGQTPALRGQALLQRIEADLPRLSPQLFKVAVQLVREGGLSHRDRITDFARLTDTAPVTVVRLAKRYGFQGFYELKMAFLAEDDATPALTPALGNSPKASEADTPHALKQALQSLRALAPMVDHPDFLQSARWLCEADVVQISRHLPEDHLPALGLVQALRLLGVPAQLVPPVAAGASASLETARSVRLHVALAAPSKGVSKAPLKGPEAPGGGRRIVLLAAPSAGVDCDGLCLSLGMDLPSGQVAPMVLGLVSAWAGALRALR